MVSRWLMIHVVDAIHSSLEILLCQVMATHGCLEAVMLDPASLPTRIDQRPGR